VLLVFLLSCSTERFQIKSCELPIDCMEVFGLGSQCNAGVCEDIKSLPDGCSSVPSNIQDDWSSYRNAKVVGGIMDIGSASHVGFSLAIEEVYEQGKSNLPIVGLTCDASLYDTALHAKLVDSYGVDTWVGPSSLEPMQALYRNINGEGILLSPSIPTSKFDSGGESGPSFNPQIPGNVWSTYPSFEREASRLADHLVEVYKEIDIGIFTFEPSTSYDFSSALLNHLEVGDDFYIAENEEVCLCPNQYCEEGCTDLDGDECTSIDVDGDGEGIGECQERAQLETVTEETISTVAGLKSATAAIVFLSDDAHEINSVLSSVNNVFSGDLYLSGVASTIRNWDGYDGTIRGTASEFPSPAHLATFPGFVGDEEGGGLSICQEAGAGSFWSYQDCYDAAYAYDAAWLGAITMLYSTLQPGSGFDETNAFLSEITSSSGDAISLRSNPWSGSLNAMLAGGDFNLDGASGLLEMGPSQEQSSNVLGWYVGSDEDRTLSYYDPCLSEESPLSFCQD
jgi:hypothetical protein